MRLVTDENTYIKLKDEYGRVRNEAIIVCSKIGWGKTLFLEGLAQKFNDFGFTVLILGDPKQENEWCFQQFNPRESYHLEGLKKVGREPKGRPIIMHHPFSFDIPTHSLPKINFFTLNIKQLARSEWGLLAETESDTETIRILLDCVKNLSDDAGIYELTHAVQRAVRGKREGKVRKPDPKNFFLEAQRGSIKAVSEISMYLSPYKHDYFLASANCNLNINWKEILNDNKNYHCFSSCFISDEKTRDFLVLALLDGVLKNKGLAKKPLCIILPEIRKICPQRAEGHKRFLATGVKEAMSLMRASGKGMSILMDSQSYIDIDENIRNTASATFLGETGGLMDIERISKSLQYKRDVREQLAHMDYPNSFLKVGREDMGGFSFLFPSGMHCEETYNYFQICKEEKPEEQQKYTELIKLMREKYDFEVKKFKERAERLEKLERERKEKEKREKEKTQSKKEDVGKEKKHKKQSEEKEKKIKLVCKAIIENPELVTREIGETYGISHTTVAKILRENLDRIKEEMEKSEDEK